MKTVCIFHRIDLDGWMSAAIVKHWFNQQEIPNKEGEPINTLDFLGYNYGDPIPDLSGYDRIIMCDISFPVAVMDKIASKMGHIQRDFIWIDHHISAIKECSIEINGEKYIAGYGGIRDIKYAACELTWNFFFPDEKMPEIVRLLGRYDCFGHKGTDEELKVLEFQYGARSYIDSYEKAFSFLINDIKFPGDYTRLIQNSGESIYKYLCTEAEQSYKNGFEITFYRGKENSIPEYYRFICVNKERFNPINFGIDYHKDGYDGVACFHFDGEQWKISLYNDNGEVDVSEIAKQFNGGGHRGAAGFVLDKDADVYAFLIS